ncbi:MarR family winged helix-turn-helix transcriptional regulator [[Enterobacter] lignolyticus]|uniref:MarR family transcriptional regulator n=1 Tax=[Enterobacter] lignolyticus TaxID=1334193 RepID=A0A806X4L3_9ENTR|nr:MarR family winged helix-turn-helix transcriptional regulator [[Enterobacter] lignolyticus]ALR76544.1 MarR family transcriptional regulator [[Enterobacter] lignolyticus]
MQDAHKKYDITDFHGALLDIMGVMNHPLRDEVLMNAADVRLDQALFPLLVTIGRYGPSGVVELADRLGRDYTTVSRQVTRLLALGLVNKRAGRHDKRVSEVTITAVGEALTQRIDEARQRLMNSVFADWPQEDVQQLFSLLRRYAQAVKGEAPSGDSARR